ncbi:helix-turn-helix domain-containing protein [Phnomibacter ginsenosidimutans]|nr:helix-turn-helix domain-containing protein [Phnomibacter ginsenosidimutans]
MLYYFGAGITLFLLLILVSKKGKTIADKILAVWLLVIALHTSLFIINLQPATIDNIHWILAVGTPFPLLHGPFLWLYTAASTNMLPVKRKFWVIHFLPAIITVIYLLPLYLLDAQQKMDIFISKGQEYQTANTILIVLIQLSGLIYISWSFFLLQKHKKNIGEQFSYEEKINLNWLRYLIYGLLVIWVIIILLKKNSLIFGAGVVFVTLLGFLGIRQVGIFGNSRPFVPEGLKPAVDPATEAPKPLMQHNTAFENANEPKEIKAAQLSTESNHSKKKYANSGLSAAVAIEVHVKLTMAMQQHKWYTEHELSLAMLAEKLNIHPNYLSQVINEKEMKSFFDYINSLRVEEFKRLVSLPESNQYTMLSIAYDCGFNSKSSFNKNFKKVTGVSPSEYIAGLSTIK